MYGYNLGKLSMQALVALSLISPTALVAENYAIQPPKLDMKGKVIFMSEGKEVILDAERLQRTARADLFTRQQMWRMIFGGDTPTAPSAKLQIKTDMPVEDMPGRGFYVVKLEKSNDGRYFNTDSENASTPIKKYTVWKPKELGPSTKEGGLTVFTMPDALKPGFYAIYISDNNYGWAFEVK